MLDNLKARKLEELSEKHDVKVEHLERLCSDLLYKGKQDNTDVLDLVETELESGLDINKIILKYNLEEGVDLTCVNNLSNVVG